MASAARMVVILPDGSLGGRLMVRLQTLDLRIGVRVPASQPLIPNKFRDSAELL